jgi:PAS domain S-box-containing protein
MATAAEFFDFSPDLLCIATPEGYFEMVNANWERTLGYSPDELLARPFLEFVHPDDVEKTVIATNQLIEGHDAIDFQNRYRAKDGTYRWLSWNAKQVDGMFYSTARDVTELKDAAASARLAAVVESATDAILTKDTERRITSWNSAAERLYGYSEQEVVGRRVDLLAPPERRGEQQTIMERTLKGEVVQAFDTQRLTKDGLLIDISLAVAPIRNASGQVIGASSVARDISEEVVVRRELRDLSDQLERRVEERTHELELANGGLEAANRELEAFSYSVSHDLRAPLRAIDGFSNALSKRYAGQLDDPGRRMLERVRAGTTKMGDLIDSMLVLSRLTRRELKLQSVDLSAMARGIATELEDRAPERTVDIAIDDGLEAVADAELAHAALVNLIENAWKFTSHQEHARIELTRADADGRTLVLRDNGAGFDVTYADKLFGPFERLHRNDEFPGTGIGLTTVQRIVRRHGGTVRGEGEVGKGAAFYFDFGAHTPMSAEESR